MQRRARSMTGHAALWCAMLAPRPVLIAPFLNPSSRLPFSMHGHGLANAWNGHKQQGRTHA